LLRAANARHPFRGRSHATESQNSPLLALNACRNPIPSGLPGCSRATSAAGVSARIDVNIFAPDCRVYVPRPVSGFHDFCRADVADLRHRTIRPPCPEHLRRSRFLDSPLPWRSRLSGTGFVAITGGRFCFTQNSSSQSTLSVRHRSAPPSPAREPGGRVSANPDDPVTRLRMWPIRAAGWRQEAGDAACKIQIGCTGGGRDKSSSAHPPVATRLKPSGRHLERHPANNSPGKHSPGKPERGAHGLQPRA